MLKDLKIKEASAKVDLAGIHFLVGSKYFEVQIFLRKFYMDLANFARFYL